MTKSLVAKIILVLVLLGGFVWFFGFSEALDSDTDSVRAEDKISLDLQIELADTAEEKRQGLMFREELCEKCGMVFDFEREQQVQFWMKNTLISLDIITITENGRITAIHENTITENDEIFYKSFEPVRYVLEVNAGYADQNNLEVGDVINIAELLEDPLDYQGQFPNT